MLEDAEELGRKKAARVSVPSRRAWTSLCGRRGARDCSPSCGRPRPGARRLDWDRGHHRFGRVSAATTHGGSRALLLGILFYHFLHLFTAARSRQGRPEGRRT